MNAITLYRIGHWCYKRRIPIIPGLMYYLIYLIYNASIPIAVEMGEGTKFAKILGSIHIGTGSVIGANAVVIHDVPPHSVVAGVPARVIRKDIKIEDDYDWSPIGQR